MRTATNSSVRSNARRFSGKPVSLTSIRLNSGLAKAQSVFNRMQGKPRHDIIAAIAAKGLTPTTATTYYHKLLSASGRRSATGTQRGRRPDEKSKAGIARRLFAKLSDQPRQKVLQAFMSKAHLTPAGASSYYHRLQAAA